MALWSQSHFLQSLGWATLNSFWQMALLWSLFLAAKSIFKISSENRYKLATAAIIGGFGWFVLTFLLFYLDSGISGISLFNKSLYQSESLINIFLLSASVSYLALLIFPAYRLFGNWRYVQKIKKEGLQKAGLNYRLYVQKIAAQLGIKKKVLLFISELVTSPITIGYLKPIILLPVAALNNLTVEQAEAILLHELSHIRRYDYLFNFIISIINTILYFNPFVKQFMKVMEEERENCCDQLVLHYGYDKISYASALLTLEKASVTRQILVLGAAGKKNLLNRIENIIGMEKKNHFKLNQFAGLIAAFFFITIFNSVLIIKDGKQTNRSLSLAYTDITNPFHYFETGDAASEQPVIINNPKTFSLPVASNTNNNKAKSAGVTAPDSGTSESIDESSAPTNDDAVLVNFDEVDGTLTPVQKEEVAKAVKNTKKVVSTLQWENIENTIADAMSVEEKKAAKQEYMTQLDKSVSWKNIENNLKSKYQQVDWQKINANLNGALTLIQIDSIQKSYSSILTELDKVKIQCDSKGKVSFTPLPDQSIESINKSRTKLRKNIKLLQALKTKNVVKL